MAESADEIIIIDDNEAASYDTSESTQKDVDTDEAEQKKKIILFSAIALFVTILIIVTLVLLLSSDEQETQITMDVIEEKLDNQKPKPIEPSKLESMIAKANYLYANGSKQKALHLYEEIAIYSEAISQYNLGVAQLKDNQYAIALQTFKKAIKNDEKRCVSAINAAVCALHLKDQETFDYYIELAYAYLSHEIDSPLYSYYYTLINYYKHNYLEALASLKNSTSKEYMDTQKQLSAKINALFGNNYDAIESLEEDYFDEDSFSLGLLYANIGDLTLAQKYLDDAVLKGIEPQKAGFALALVNIKAGRISQATAQIKEVTKEYPEEVYKAYPLKIFLKDSLFDAQQAQLLYRDKINEGRPITYQKLFYYSPYKVFNANQTISYIRKGNANIFIDNVQSAQKYLKKSASSSSVNRGIAQAIKKALSFQLREANAELNKLLKLQPKHSILHYNLALTYAQLGDLQSAYKHFLRSYYLDAKNYLSGIYAVMCGQIINKDIKKLKSIIKDSLQGDEESEEKNLYKTLIYMSEDNFLAIADWLNYDYKQRPLYLALNTIIALKLDKMDIAKKASEKLTILMPNDILPHLMNIDTHYAYLKPKKYAAKVIAYMAKQKFNFDDLYYGPYVTRYLYIQQSLITGHLYFLIQQLKAELQTTSYPPHELTYSLALASLYNQNFEESYTLFNQIIDDLKIRDAKTLFLGAVASTAANHHENAIALLELSKMKDPNFLESRYALGLLYLEIRNNNGATIQLARIQENGFSSDYFDFKIDTNKLLFEKQHPQE